jgi:2-oxoglutarate dehydrogenase E2 component (dihydrolipoamide succinyltransferase)/2-oxoisovalerate dehydrogenase E2 component (dihydrolipoyl transacylase)
VITDIIMPQLGESVAEGTLIKWLVPQGGFVTKDQSLLEVETDKVSLEIPSPASGSLTEILIQEGETVAVGSLLARLENHVETTNNHDTRESTILTPQNEPSTAEGSHHLSPAVRQLAKEHGMDLSQITGTGHGGRITKRDLLDYLKHHETHDTLSTSVHERESGEPHPSAREKLIPLTSMRRTIAERMVQSRHTSAQVVTCFEADLSCIEKYRHNHSLTYLPFIIRAVTQAIRAFPILNSSWSDQGIVIKQGIHIGIAVALEEGLLVPVIRNADQKGLTQLGKEISDLAERARTKQLSPDEVQSGTFTITNHGGTGSLFSTPIIHQPQIAILGVGAVQKRLVVINDAIAIRPMSYLSLSFDHRVIDGATADHFMSKIKALVEQEQWETDK